MPQPQPTETRNLDRYGNAPLPWSRAHTLLESGPKGPLAGFFLGTVGPDARPHVAGVGALWHDGELYFTSGPGTRKSRDLSANPACTLAVKFPGLDLTFEGVAFRVQEDEVLESVAAAYRQLGWPAVVDAGIFTATFSAPSAGPPPWHLYRFTCHTAVGVASEEPHGATLWRFSGQGGLTA
ncbi:MAG TPA: pyridoxamine 5'-phosphate oxidase [Acidimicrobiaceae bacterium]|nr:pyridoxamine 5'-phosphate oxidase [Acidimicrobiaceae bacterium]